MKKLEHFAMYIFDEDVTVVPKWSGWFGDYNKTSDKRTRLQDRPIYTEDWLGLKWLDEENRLEFRNVSGKHMHLTDEILEDAFKKYFSKKVDIPSEEQILAKRPSLEL